MTRWRAVAFALALAVAAAAPVQPQEGFFRPVEAAAASVPSQAELDRLLAPVALYPDALLGQLLAASTYPLEVVSLHRWLDRNPGLEGAALEAALAAQPWDAAVKALAPFRSLVATMDAELAWTQALGDAVLADEGAVMDAVQRLRRKAMEAGSLAANARENVTLEDQRVFIEPADPALIPVPVYDASVVYGPWWWPGYPPYPWTYLGFGPIDYYYGPVGFAVGYVLWPGWWSHHAHPDWHGRHLAHSRPGHPPARWSHNPVHRGGVPYVDRGVRERYAGRDSGVQGRHEFRGFERTPGATGRSVPPASPPSALHPLARDSARLHAERGRESLRASPPARAAPNPPAPRATPSPSAPAHGGAHPAARPSKPGRTP